LPCRSPAGLEDDAIMAPSSLDMLQTGQYLCGVTGQYCSIWHACEPISSRFRRHREMTLTDLLTDPMTRAVC